MSPLEIATRLSKKKRETIQPLVISFIIRSLFILPSCRNRHRTHRSVTFYFTVLSEPSQDSSLMTKKNISVLNCIICFYSININTFYLIFIEFTSRFAGKVYPYARIKQRKYRKSPENLTKSVRSSGLFFLPGGKHGRNVAAGQPAEKPTGTAPNPCEVASA